MRIIIEALEKDKQVLNIIRPERNERRSLHSLKEFIEENRSLIDNKLLETGAMLFRGFEINEEEEFLEIKAVLAGNIHFDYIDGNSPRTKLSHGVYTSTDYPKEYSISLHSELSYSHKWPSRIMFFCKKTADQGGETPIVDCRMVLTKLRPQIVEKFSEYGVKYTRYLRGNKGIGKSWMDTFMTTNKEVVEKYCQEGGMDCFWEGDSLFISQIGPGVAFHPLTKEKVWFNQANQFHPSGLQEDIYKMLKMVNAKNVHKYPQYAFYGNGDEILEEDLKEITDVHSESALLFKWEQGDILLLDNMLMAHGRMPFEGARKVCVSMY